jgi:hypothetical protein
MNTELVKVDPKQYGLEESKAAEITKGLTTIITERDVLTKCYLDLIETEITPESVPVFKELRLKISKNRTQGLIPWHKQNKAYFLAGGNFVQAIFNKEVAENERMEEKLMEAEKYFENIEKERIAKLEIERIELTKQYTEYPASNLGLMDNVVFDSYLVGLKVAYDAKIKAEQEAEAERLRLIEVEKENARLKAIEDERIRKENEILKAEAEAREKAIEAERKRQADLLAKQKAEAEEMARIEKEKQDAILAKERAEAIAKQKAIEDAARIEREKAETERKLLEKEIADRKEAERIAAEKKAKSAPDKVKLVEFAINIENIAIPEVKSEEAAKILTDVKTLLSKVSVFIREKSELL